MVHNALVNRDRLATQMRGLQLEVSSVGWTKGELSGKNLTNYCFLAAQKLINKVCKRLKKMYALFFLMLIHLLLFSNDDK